MNVINQYNEHQQIGSSEYTNDSYHSIPPAKKMRTHEQSSPFYQSEQAGYTYNEDSKSDASNYFNVNKDGSMSWNVPKSTGSTFTKYGRSDNAVTQDYSVQSYGKGKFQTNFNSDSNTVGNKQAQQASYSGIKSILKTKKSYDTTTTDNYDGNLNNNFGIKTQGSFEKNIQNLLSIPALKCDEYQPFESSYEKMESNVQSSATNWQERNKTHNLTDKYDDYRIERRMPSDHLAQDNESYYVTPNIKSYDRGGIYQEMQPDTDDKRPVQRYQKENYDSMKTKYYDMTVTQSNDIEELFQREEEEKQRDEELKRILEKKRIEEEERIFRDEERRIREQGRRRRDDERRRRDDEKRYREDKRITEEERKREEQRMHREDHRKEEEKRREEQRRRREEQRKREEEKRREEERRRGGRKEMRGKGSEG